MPQLYEGPVYITEGSLEYGVECKGTFQLFNMQTGELHREGTWAGTYCGSVMTHGMLYHEFVEAEVAGRFCGFFGQPAYRFQGKTGTSPQSGPWSVDTEGLLFCGAGTHHSNHTHMREGHWYQCEGICTCGNSLAECDPKDHL